MIVAVVLVVAALLAVYAALAPKILSPNVPAIAAMAPEKVGEAAAPVKEAAPRGALALSCINDAGTTTVEPNAIFDVSNEWFEGRMLVAVKGLPGPASFAAMFHGKKRIVEFQMQGKFPKGPPPGELFMGGRLVDADAGAGHGRVELGCGRRVAGQPLARVEGADGRPDLLAVGLGFCEGLSTSTAHSDITK